MIIGVIIGARDGGEISFVAAEDLLSAGMRFYDDIPNEIFISEECLLCNAGCTLVTYLYL